MERGSPSCAPPASQPGAGSRVATVEQLKAWVATARPGQRFVWLTAASMVNAPIARAAAALHREGKAELGSSPRSDGTRDWWVRRVGTRGGRGRAGPLAVRDPKAAVILRVLRRRAEAGRACPSDKELARIAGLATRAQAAGRIAKLKAHRFIRTEIFDGPDGPWRVVEIVSNGFRTAPPATGGAHE